MPFAGLWGRFDRIPMVRKQRFSMSKLKIWSRALGQIQFDNNSILSK
jgi:hypothetical protein